MGNPRHHFRKEHHYQRACYHFDGQCGSVSDNGIQLDGGEDNADISQGCKEQFGHIGGTSNNCSTLVTFAKTGSREATLSEVENEDNSPTTTIFVDVGTSPIDLGADNATDCSQAAPVLVDSTSSITNEDLERRISTNHGSITGAIVHHAPTGPKPGGRLR